MALRVRKFPRAFEERAPGRNGIRNVGFYGGRKIGEPGEKPPEKDKNQQQTQPTYGNVSESNPGLLVGGEHSQNWAALLPREYRQV